MVSILGFALFAGGASLWLVATQELGNIFSNNIIANMFIYYTTVIRHWNVKKTTSCDHDTMYDNQLAIVNTLPFTRLLIAIPLIMTRQSESKRHHHS